MGKPTARELLDTTAVPGDEPWSELADRVEAVLALHRRGSVDEDHGAWCEECNDTAGISLDWPCPTVRLLNGEAK